MDLTNAYNAANANGKPPGGIDAFDAATAESFGPLPAGVYVCRIERGQFGQTKTTGTDCYTIRFSVTEGDHAGASLWRVWVFSKSAMRYAVTDLKGTLGMTGETMRAPFPGRTEYVVRLTVTQSTRADGTASNDVKGMELIRKTAATDTFARFALDNPAEGGTP